MEVLHHVDAERLAAARAAGDVLWLDLENPSDEDRLKLAEALELPPRWLDVAAPPGHPPLIDHDWALMAAAGARPVPDGCLEPVDVRLGVRGPLLVTVHRAEGFGLADRVGQAQDELVHLLFAALLALADSVSDSLEEARGFVVLVQDVAEATAAGREQQKRPDERSVSIMRLRSDLLRMGQALDRELDAYDAADAPMASVPGALPKQIRYLRQRAVRSSQHCVELRDLLADARNTEMTALSTRLNTVTERLTVVATVFLPLTVITGYFGMNFNWLTSHISSLWVFVIWGVAVPVVAAVGILAYIGRLDRSDE